MVRIPLFLSSLVSSSVRPLKYGKTAKPRYEEFVFPKSRPPVDQQTNEGLRGRFLKIRVKEHTRNTKAFKKGSNIATHAWLNNYSLLALKVLV